MFNLGAVAPTVRKMSSKPTTTARTTATAAKKPTVPRPVGIALAVGAGIIVGAKVGRMVSPTSAGAVGGAIAAATVAAYLTNRAYKGGIAGLDGEAEYDICCERLKASGGTGYGLYSYCTDGVCGAGWKERCLNPAPPPEPPPQSPIVVDDPSATPRPVQHPWPWWYLPEGVIMSNGAVDPARRKEGAKAGKTQEAACLRDTWNEWNATWGTNYNIRDPRFKSKAREFAKGCKARHKNWKSLKRAEGVKVP